ncbi:MAG TPA: FAD-binding oxidoreductase [Solirubrobacteraceae bacterium]|jgi:FAD/FMN-containing dehydrogenase
MLELDTEVRTASDPGWDEARQAWNLSVDQHPEAVAFPESAEDVAAVVVAARDRGLRVTAQATGHGATPLGPLDRTVLIKTSRMRAASVDAEARVARVEAGAQWMDVVELAAEHGLAGLAGSAPDVGIAGYTLGGGQGWLGRKYGLACNSVVAAEVVLGDGRRVRADASNEADLFWALRGGGGSFGIVTALDFRLYPVASLYAGNLYWPWERASEVLHAWRELTLSAPDELSSLGRILQYPPLPLLPEHLRGRQFVVVESALIGDEAAGAELLAPLRALGPEMDTVATIPPTMLHTLHNDPPQPVPGRGDGGLLAELPAEAVDAFVATVGPESGSPLLGAEIRHFGGAMATAPEDAGAMPAIPAPYGTFCVGMAPVPPAIAAVEAHLDRVAEALRPWAADHDFPNLKDRPSDPVRLFGASSAARLAEVKAQVDPDGVIRANHPVV